MSLQTLLPVTLFLLIFSRLLHADDLGPIGPSYPIAERDLIEVMQSRYRQMEKSGELARRNEDYKRRIIQGAENPPPIPGIRRAETSHHFSIDPSYTLEKPIQDEQGRTLFPAGTRINPLDYETMHKTLLFFDAREKSQRRFAENFIRKSPLPVKPVLIGGSPLALMRQWKAPVYYDQHGALTRYFRITHSPAIVTQEGKRFRIDEIKVD